MTVHGRNTSTHDNLCLSPSQFQLVYKISSISSSFTSPNPKSSKTTPPEHPQDVCRHRRPARHRLFPRRVSASSTLAIRYSRHHPIAAVYLPTEPPLLPSLPPPQPQTSSRYESQKRRDWYTFGQYLRNHRPPLALPRCSGANVLEFMRYLDQFGKTKVHNDGCPFYGHPIPPASCPCPLRQAWGSLDALVGRLRAAYEENGGRPDTNPFGARAVRLYLREVRDSQAKARGIAYEKKRRKKPVLSSSQLRAHQERNRHGCFTMQDHEMAYCGGDLGYGHA